MRKIILLAVCILGQQLIHSMENKQLCSYGVPSDIKSHTKLFLKKGYITDAPVTSIVVGMNEQIDAMSKGLRTMIKPSLFLETQDKIVILREPQDKIVEKEWEGKIFRVAELQQDGKPCDDVLVLIYKSCFCVSRGNIALPTLGTKVGHPIDKATEIAINTIKSCIKQYPEYYDYIYLMVESDEEFDIYKKTLDRSFLPI